VRQLFNHLEVRQLLRTKPVRKTGECAPAHRGRRDVVWVRGEKNPDLYEKTQASACLILIIAYLPFCATASLLAPIRCDT